MAFMSTKLSNKGKRLCTMNVFNQNAVNDKQKNYNNPIIHKL
jgi:hypothetical protein